MCVHAPISLSLLARGKTVQTTELGADKEVKQIEKERGGG